MADNSNDGRENYVVKDERGGLWITWEHRGHLRDALLVAYDEAVHQNAIHGGALIPAEVGAEFVGDAYDERWAMTVSMAVLIGGASASPDLAAHARAVLARVEAKHGASRALDDLAEAVEALIAAQGERS